MPRSQLSFDQAHVSERRWARTLHRVADRLHGSIHPRLHVMPPLERAWVRVLDAIVELQADRAYFRNSILPALALLRPGRVLFVGVRGYNRGTAEAFRSFGSEFWTFDIDPSAASHGAPGRHIVSDACELDRDFPPRSFDLVITNGVYGWGVDGAGAMNRATIATHRILKPGGYLLLGWNADRIEDPASLESLRELFVAEAPAGLPQRQTFAAVTHVYAWYRARSDGN